MSRLPHHPRLSSAPYTHRRRRGLRPTRRETKERSERGTRRDGRSPVTSLRYLRASFVPSALFSSLRSSEPSAVRSLRSLPKGMDRREWRGVRTGTNSPILVLSLRHFIRLTAFSFTLVVSSWWVSNPRLSSKPRK